MSQSDAPLFIDAGTQELVILDWYCETLMVPSVFVVISAGESQSFFVLSTQTMFPMVLPTFEPVLTQGCNPAWWRDMRHEIF
jgi:hypothetical protein